MQPVQVDSNGAQGSDTVGEIQAPKLEIFAVQEETQRSEESSNMKKQLSNVLLDDGKKSEKEVRGNLL